MWMKILRDEKKKRRGAGLVKGYSKPAGSQSYVRVGPTTTGLLGASSTTLARCSGPFGGRRVVEDPEYSGEIVAETVRVVCL